jgi:hypothetical protein
MRPCLPIIEVLLGLRILPVLACPGTISPSPEGMK